jgi:hypothetical protein
VQKHRARSLTGLGAAAVVAVLALSGCGQQGGLSLARQACVHVNRSLHDYTLASARTTSPSAAATLRTEADQELRLALPLAAQANSADGSWNSLMTAISEINTVDEGHLMPSLKAQCEVADTNVNVNPSNGNNGPGTNNTGNTANVNPQ